MTTAYSYIRFSTPAQLKGDSLRRQLRKSERYAAEHGLTLDSSLRDTGLSAYKGAHRKKGALASFLAKIEGGEIARGSYLIVENIDRLSRENPWDALGMVQKIIGAEITVVSLVDDMVYSLDRLRNRAELMTTLQAALTKGHRESKDKADRLQEVWAEKRAEVEGGGRRKLTRQGPGWLDLIPDDPREPLVGEWRFNDRAPIVRDIFEMCVEGLGKEAIARRLNARGVPPFKHGDGWGMSAVAELLKDRRTIGELQLCTKVGGPRRPIGEPIKGYFPPVVSEEIFYRAQAEIAKRHCGASPSRTGKVPNIFVGIAHCQCGRVMEYRDRQGKRPSPGSIFLTCSGNRRGHVCSNDARFPYGELERAVLDWVTDIKVSDAEANKAGVAAIKLAGKEAERDDTKRRLNAAFAKWESEDDQALKTMLYTSVQRYSAALPKIEEEIASLSETVRATKRSTLDGRRVAVRNLRDEMATLEGEALFDMRAKLAAALRQVIDRVEFHPDKTFGVTLRGGLKLYTFANGSLLRSYDLSDANPDGADKLLTFPQAETIDALKLHPMTLSGIRETLAAIAEPVRG
jgi:DNA invertase Pin-like site-specific DNA recombinase